MTHEDAGHYAAKHPPGSAPDPKAAAMIKEKAKDGRISCAVAHKIAETLTLAPADIGKNIDLMELRLNKCQMGLFGYYPQKKKVQAAESVVPDLQKVLEETVQNGRIPCDESWKIADRFNMKRLDLAGACEKLKIKISPCQLGAF